MHLVTLIPSIFKFHFSAGRTTFHKRAVKTQCFGMLTFKMSYPAQYLFDTQGVSRARFIANNIVSRTWHFRFIVFCNTCLQSHRLFVVKNTVCVTWRLRCAVFCNALPAVTSPVHCKKHSMRDMEFTMCCVLQGTSCSHIACSW